jgi:Na+-transporting NADH:ubiquinone oxidoreductase subunit A
VTVAPASDGPVARRAGEFEAGFGHLSDLTKGPVFVCQAGGSPQAATGRIRFVPCPAGRPITHVIHDLHPVADGGEVWTIEAQDVLAIASLMRTGQWSPDRLVSLTGPRARAPRVIRLNIGADLGEIARRERTDGPAATITRAGTDRYWRDADWLGVRDRAVSLDSRRQGVTSDRKAIGWLSRIMGAATPRPVVPISALDRLLPPGIYPIPLLRALSVGDLETAKRLGCLALLEEDMDPLTAACGTGIDYGRLLRTALDQIEAGL